MKRLIVKDCPICEKIIWKKEKVIIDGKEYERLVKNEFGTHFWVRSNYGTLMKIAICVDCLKNLDKPKVAQIVSDIVWTWILELQENKELSEDKQRYEFEKARFFIATDFANTEEELIFRKV